MTTTPPPADLTAAARHIPGTMCDVREDPNYPQRGYCHTHRQPVRYEPFRMSDLSESQLNAIVNDTGASKALRSAAIGEQMDRDERAQAHQCDARCEGLVALADIPDEFLAEVVASDDERVSPEVRMAAIREQARRVRDPGRRQANT